MTEYDPKAVNGAMAEGRGRMAHAQRQLVGNSTVDDAIEIADRMGDLLDILLALQPHEVRLLGGLAEGLWGADHRDKRLVLANLRDVMEAIA